MSGEGSDVSDCDNGAAAATTFQDLGSRPPLSPSCSASSMLRLSVPWLLLSSPLSLTFLLHSTSLPYLRCCVVVVVVALLHIDVRSSSRWWSPFAFQDVKLSPNDLKYPFFLFTALFLCPHYVEIPAVQSQQQSPSVENANKKKVHMYAYTS